jgi:hypothetical protein
MRPWHSARAASIVSTSRVDSVEILSRGSRDSADSSFSQLSSTKKVSVSLRMTARSKTFCVSAPCRDVYTMVGAPYISESVQNRCKELGIGYVDITNQLPATRERTVLLELLRVMRSLQNDGIEVVICG